MASSAGTEFKASLFNPATPTVFDYILTPDGLNLLFSDYSNYTTNYDSGHLLAFFTLYRKVIITHHSGAVYTMSSLGDGNELISSAAAGSMLFNYFLQNKDGVYSIKLLTVPTYSFGANYLGGISTVWLPSTAKLYKAITSNALTPPDLNPADWEVIEDEDLSMKYTDVADALVTFDADKCKCKLTKKAACLIKSNPCNPDLLCKSPCLLNAVKVMILLESANQSFIDLDLNCAGTDIDLIKQICECDCGCPDC